MCVYWTRVLTTGLMIGSLGLAGCSGGGSKSPTPTGDKPGASKDDKGRGHTHERGKMLIADAGPYHALLTAHLSSKDGNELDIFFETADESNAKPVPLAVKSFTAQATTGNGESMKLKFEPTPKEERKDDPEGKCSHFVAKAGWMKHTVNLLVVAKVTIDGKEVTIRWKDFNPKKYAHHED